VTAPRRPWGAYWLEAALLAAIFAACALLTRCSCGIEPTPLPAMEARA
jgi:hypothetical protein